MSDILHSIMLGFALGIVGSGVLLLYMRYVIRYVPASIAGLSSQLVLVGITGCVLWVMTDLLFTFHLTARRDRHALFAGYLLPIGCTVLAIINKRKS
jgi:hypothetical protein